VAHPRFVDLGRPGGGSCEAHVIGDRAEIRRSRIEHRQLSGGMPGERRSGRIQVRVLRAREAIFVGEERGAGVAVVVIVTGAAPWIVVVAARIVVVEPRARRVRASGGPRRWAIVALRDVAVAATVAIVGRRNVAVAATALVGGIASAVRRSELIAGIESAAHSAELTAGIESAADSPELIAGIESAAHSPELVAGIESAAHSSELIAGIESAARSPELVAGIDAAVGGTGFFGVVFVFEVVVVVLVIVVIVFAGSDRRIRIGIGARQDVGVADRLDAGVLGGRCIDAGDQRGQHEKNHDEQPGEPPLRAVARPCHGSYGANVLATLTDNALAVLRARYLVREGGAIAETPEQMFARVAAHVSAAERQMGYSLAEVAAAGRIFERMMSSLEFLPNSPTLMNAGRPLGQLAACFVVPVEDSTTGVFEAVRWAAEIQKTGGGTGFSFSRLRPAGDLVASTGGTASGPVSLMQVFDVATEAIKQGGTRRGANMGMLRVDHPDILEFIALKLEPSRMRNFNLSVAVTDGFMSAVRAGSSYELINPRTGQVTGRLDARRVLDAIANAAWACGDPGLVFIDRVNDVHPTPGLGAIEATNPCVTGETRIWVEERGLVPIAELVGTTPSIATLDRERVVFRRATQVVATGVRPIVRLATAEGLELRLTADHRVFTARGDVPAGDLQVGDRVCALPPAEGRAEGCAEGCDRRDRAWATVAGISMDGEAEVFDLTEPATGHFFANGVLVHNCGEQPLLPFESCTLGSIDVGRFAAAGELDWARLGVAIHDAVRFLDDVIDANRYPLPEIERATKATRKIGLGIMGWADALAELGIAYDSDAALALADRLASFLERESLAASAALADRRGAFPAWRGSRWDDAGERALRNSTTTTIAPTGTISIIAGCASGIEPLYALAYRRNVLDGAELTEINPRFRRIAAERGFASDALFAAVVERGGVRGRSDVPDDVQRAFPTAHEIDVATHVRMQAAFQRHVHAAVSKTINLRRDATPLEVKAAYQLAYELGCKGITVYRDGSREGQVLVTGARSAIAAAAPRCPECGSALVVQSGCRLCRHCGWSVCG
jgi:ribonucleoside-diphosphate reductase alpha chain